VKRGVKEQYQRCEWAMRIGQLGLSLTLNLTPNPNRLTIFLRRIVDSKDVAAVRRAGDV